DRRGVPGGGHPPHAGPDLAEGEVRGVVEDEVVGVLQLRGGAEDFLPVGGVEFAADEPVDVDASLGCGEAGHQLGAAHFEGGDEGGLAAGEGDVCGEVHAE